MAFTAIANWVVAGVSTFATVGAAFAAGAYGIAALGAMAAIGAAYVTSRVINGNPNKGNNSANNQGGRIQVAPATNNKIPVIYGNVYVNGMITDARLSTLDQKDNNVMFYCIVLGETTNNINTTYGLEGVYWNDLRLTPLAATGENSHIVKDGRKVVNVNNNPPLVAGNFVVDKTYVITKLGTTTQAQWNTIAGTSATPRVYGVGSVFQAATDGASSGTGEAQEEDFIDENFIVGANQNVMLRVYAGGSTSADQIYPPQSAGNNANAYNFWGSTPANPNGDGSWTSANEMKGLIFAIVKLRYDGSKGFTSLPNVTFNIANNVTNPADVWYDYMTSERYGAGIDPAYIDTAAQAVWYDFCEEDISYTSVNLDPQGGAGTTNQATSRYSINGIIDTSNQVKTNIDTILQNGGAWMSYNVDTGLWSPVIKKAVSAGIEGDTATYFTASRSGSTLTVTTFPSGRIEAGQLLYDSTDAYIGTISAQIAPVTVTAGSFIVGQTYTIVSVGSTNFTLIGASANTVGISFTATGVGSGSGTAITSGETAGQIGRYTTSSSGTITTTTFYTLPASVLEFSDDNIISGISISSTRLEDLYNQVEVEFYNKYNKDQKAYFRNNLDEADRNPNEPDNQLRMSLDLCNNSMQADILGQMELRQSRDDLVIEFTSTHYGIQAQGGDVIAITSDLYGWYPKYFRVMRVKEIEGDDGSLVANIQALEYNPDAYTVEAISEFSSAANIGIGVYGASPNLPLPPSVVIAAVDADAPIPNFQLQVTIPASGGPFDEIELYYTEGWDEHGINGKIVEGQVAVTVAAGTGSVATLTFTAPSPSFTPYDVGQVVTIAGMTPSGYNGVKTITAATASTISYASTATGAMTVAGTITNAAGAGLGLLTVTATVYGNINAGDRIDLPSDIYIVSQITNTVGPKTFSSGGVPGSNPSTSRLLTLTDVTGLIVGNTLTGTGIDNGSFILEIDPTGSPANTVRIEDAVTVQAAGTYAVTGGLGTYIVDTSVMASNVGGVAVNLFDFPEADNYKLLKKLTPEGNNPTYTNGSIVTDVVTNVPANSATYRRWFVIARMGIKKRFGAFSIPGDVDFEQGRFPYEPNPVGGGGGGLPGVFTSVDINNTTPWLTFSTQAQGANDMYGIRGISALDDPWFVGAGSTGIDSGYLEIATGDNAGDPTGDASPIYVRQYNGYASGGAPWFGGGGTVVNELVLLDEDGNTSIPNNTTIGGDLTVTGTNISTGVTNSIISIDRTTSATAVASAALTVKTTSTGTPAVGIGTSINFVGQTAAANFENAGFIAIVSTDITPASEDFSMRFGLMQAGSAYTTKMDLNSSGDLQIDGDLEVTGGNLTTTNASASLFNTNATSINIGNSASTAVRIGSAAGVVNIKSPSLVQNPDGGATSTTFNLLNTITTDLNIGGAATTVDIGSTASGTTTIGWDAVVNKDLAVNGGDITTTQTTASLFDTTATTINIGRASTATRIGALTGTTTIGYNLNLLGPTLTLNSDDTVGDFDPNIVFADDGVNPAVIVWDSGDLQFSFSKPIFTVIDKDIISSGNFVLDRSVAGVYASDNATIRVDRSVGADATITWNEATDKWNISNSVTVATDLNASSLTSNTINSSTALALTLSGADVAVAGNLAVNGATSADITTTTTAASVFNATALNVNAFGAATTTNIGNASGIVNMPGSLNVDSGTLYVDRTNNRVGINTSSPAVTNGLDIRGGLKTTTATAAERPIFQYNNNTTAGVNNSIFLRKNYTNGGGTGSYTTGAGTGISFAVISDTQTTLNPFATISASWNASAPTLGLNTSIDNGSNYLSAGTFTTATATLPGDLTVSGDTVIRSFMKNKTFEVAGSAANTVLDTWSTGTYRTAKYNVQVALRYSTGPTVYYYKTIQIVVIAKHDNSSVSIDTYADLDTVAFNLATFTATISGSTVSLKATPYGTTYTIFRIDAQYMETI